MVMKRVCITVLLVIAAFGTDLGAATTQDAEATYKADLLKIEKDRRAALIRAKTKYGESLRAIAGRYLKENNVDAALEVNTKIKTVEGEIKALKEEKIGIELCRFDLAVAKPWQTVTKLQAGKSYRVTVGGEWCYDPKRPDDRTVGPKGLASGVVGEGGLLFKLNRRPLVQFPDRKFEFVSGEAGDLEVQTDPRVNKFCVGKCEIVVEELVPGE
jgi:hypothetical protein